MGFGDGAIEHMRKMKLATLWAAKQQAGLAEGDMRTEFSWTPRSHTAHRALHAGAEISGDKIVMYLAHGVRYGNYLEEGTGIHGPVGAPYDIVPINGDALYWGAGPPVAAIRNHPGMKARPIVQPIAKRYRVSLRDALLKTWGAK